MAVIFRHFRPFITDTPRKGTTTTQSSSPRRKSKQHLQVKISKEPPTILYFERVQGEQCCEFIFDPMVCHDEEKDHPDLFMSKRNDKPWQRPPYCNGQSNNDGMMKRLTSMMRIKSFSSSSSSSSTPCSVA